jgi:hypothetical protein
MEAVETAPMILHGPGGKANREFLSDLCRDIYLPRHEEEGMTKNEVLIEFYESCGFHDFKTYRQWKQEGKQVKRGEKAFLVWARPLHSLQKEEAQDKGKPEPEAEDGPDYFPICYLFAASQVD